MFDQVKRWFSRSQREADLQAQLDKLRQHIPVPVFWLLGKTQSGKTSLVRTSPEPPTPRLARDSDPARGSPGSMSSQLPKPPCSRSSTPEDWTNPATTPPWTWQSSLPPPMSSWSP